MGGFGVCGSFRMVWAADRSPDCGRTLPFFWIADWTYGSGPAGLRRGSAGDGVSAARATIAVERVAGCRTLGFERNGRSQAVTARIGTPGRTRLRSHRAAQFEIGRLSKGRTPRQSRAGWHGPQRGWRVNRDSLQTGPLPVSPGGAFDCYRYVKIKDLEAGPRKVPWQIVQNDHFPFPKQTL